MNNIIPRSMRPKLPMFIMALLITFLILYIIDHQTSSHDNLQSPGQLKESSQDTSIHVPDAFINKFIAGGHIFDDKGVAKKLKHNMTSSLIHSFSPYTENRFKEMVLEPRHEQIVYANSPAVMWHQGAIMVVMRIWLNHELYNDKKAPLPLNTLADNHLFIQKYNNRLEPITPGSILGLPTPRQWTVGDGPIEPRLFKIDDANVFISYNTGVTLPDKSDIDSTFIWDYIRHKTIVPNIKGGSPIVKNVKEGRMPRDKHWTAYVDQGKFRMVYNLDPMRIMECTTNFSCEFVHFEGADNYQFNQNRDSLRGGSPWHLYKYPYYYSIGHSTLFRRPNYDRIYTINILILKASPVPRIVYVGGPIQIHKSIMTSVPIVRDEYISDPFFFPVSMLPETEDSIAIGGHINDYSSVLLRARGLKNILEDVVREVDQQPENTKSPPMTTLHLSTKEMAGKLYNMEFLNENDEF